MNQHQRKFPTSLLAILLLIVVLTGTRMAWIAIHPIEESMEASKGIIDLSSAPLEDRILALNGKWNFYEGAFLQGSQTDDSPSVPGDWDSKKTKGIVYGTYHLQMKINEQDIGQRMALHVPVVHSAAAVLINGELAGSHGTLSLNEEKFEGSRLPFTIDFVSNQQEVDILVHVANKGKWGNAGINSTVYVGNEKTIDRQVVFSAFNQLAVSVIFFIYSIYGAFLYISTEKRKVFGSFFFLAFFAALSILVSDDLLFYQAVPVSYEISMRMGKVVYALLAFWLIVFFKALLSKYAHHAFFYWFPLICIAYVAFVCIVPVEMLSQTRLLLGVILIMPGIMIGKQLFIMMMNGEKHTIYLLLASICIVDNVLWTVIKARTNIEYSFYPVNFVLIVILFSMFWIKQYFDSLQKKEELSKQLQENIAKKDEFLANTSHELRNPLHAIINIARSLQENNAERETNRIKGLTLISSVGERMALLLDNLLDVSLLQENEVRLNSQTLYLQSVVPGVIQTVDFLNKKDVLIINSIPPNLPPIYADEGKLIQVLFNVLRNAVDYTEKGTINIHANYEESMAFIQIKDTGVGMSEELQKKIFERYERGDSGLSAESGGIGLGLNIAKELVELHGGAITVESEVAKGTVFTFSIPLAKEDKKAAAHPPVHEKYAAPLNVKEEILLKIARRDGGNRPKILAVDDDPLNLSVLKSILENDYDICCVSGGKEALAKINQETWDLVISDIMMPQMSGYELTGLVRKRYSLIELPVLLLTAIQKSIDINTGFDAGANDYLVKPVSDIELKARVQSLVHLKRSAESRLQMEAAWLQAQVEPHFLFNTISSIMMLFEQEPGRGRDLMEYFTLFLQTSYQFHNTSQLVSIEGEVELIDSYLYIMKERFQDRLEYTVECDDEAKKYALPPLTIQPLVENAVNHGILTRAEGGKVEVFIKKREQIEITIQDNGIGISPEKMKKIREQEYKLYSGIGLRNVNERLKGHFGTGLHIESSDEIGTAITFSIPAIRSVYA